MKTSIHRNTRVRISPLSLMAALALVYPSQVFAGQAEALPWEGPLTKLANSLTGPVAQAVCLVAIVICGLTLIFGGEMGEFAKRTIYIVIVIAFILGASGFISHMFTATGALV